MRSGRFFISDVLFIKCESKHSIDFYKKICYNVNATQLNISYTQAGILFLSHGKNAYSFFVYLVV